ncbi:MAG: FadR family transcriptional regulator [Desulfobacterales bacterium]|nr:FadR family transcriptional regulator [Desulfobacterales bacterium]
MDPLFQAAKQNRIFQDVVSQIQEAIIEGRLSVGDRLPAERELKEMLQVSRGTLREALRVLEEKGLIEIKLGTGGGAIVKTMSGDQISESLDLLIRSRKVTLEHLAEFRESVEGEVVALAAKRADKSDIKNLKRLLDKAGESASRGVEFVDRFLKADKELHLAFASISGNPVYVSVLKSIHDNIHRYYDQFLAMEGREMKENFNDLCRIVEAVERGRADEARTLAKDHVNRFNQYMTDQENVYG